MGGNLSESEAEAVLVLADSDGDGELGLEDFVRLMEGAKEEEEKVEELRERLSRCMRWKRGVGVLHPKA
ncbi:calcium-binding EF-hand family protein [Actinidia rufa]|uniref:Calcium-binding EF-hand family protein n=1 Tax=Actinidia rufa TaxID=165716 RepID=A0A7J0EG69_9ERIC|nr:calcium-binding EF-hand family protein [Actinidia rufa]